MLVPNERLDFTVILNMNKTCPLLTLSCRSDTSPAWSMQVAGLGLYCNRLRDGDGGHVAAISFVVADVLGTAHGWVMLDAAMVGNTRKWWNLWWSNWGLMVMLMVIWCILSFDDGNEEGTSWGSWAGSGCYVCGTDIDLHVPSRKSASIVCMCASWFWFHLGPILKRAGQTWQTIRLSG